MKRYRISHIFCLLLCSSCHLITPYVPNNAVTGGYKEEKIQENTYKVMLYDSMLPGYTSFQIAERFILLRAAELSLLHGYASFSNDKYNACSLQKPSGICVGVVGKRNQKERYFYDYITFFRDPEEGYYNSNYLLDIKDSFISLQERYLRPEEVESVIWPAQKPILCKKKERYEFSIIKEKDKQFCGKK
jgi:hypothetical protein